MHVAVKDTGIGIREEDMGKLFSEFQRIDEKRNRKIEGTGLGISITERFLEMMGSSLQVESVYGEGSNFHFDLKQSVTDWEELGDYEAAYRSYLNKNKDYKESFTAPDARILVVDDNLMNLEVFKGLIRQTQIQTDAVQSGDEGLRLCEKNKYDIIFLDHMMPVKDGIETLKELRERENDPNKSTFAVCLTANAISGAREEYLEAGFDDYLTKPIDPSELEEMLIHYLPEDKILFRQADDGENGEDAMPSDESSGLFSILKEQDRISLENGINNSGSEEAYLKMLKIFFESADEKAAEIERLYRDKDIKNYTIKVHALKSSAGIIGALQLKEEAQALENAGKSGDIEYINSNNGSFLDDVREVRKLIAPLFETGYEKREMADEALIKGFYAELKTAAEEMDCSTIDELFAAIEDYSFPPEEEAFINELRSKSEQFEYDNIADMLKRNGGG